VGADRIAELAPEDATYCARHPETETYLRCGRCGTPICPRCLVQTPVGARCPDCAHRTRIPTLEVGLLDLVKAYGAAMVSGAAVGAVWAFVVRELFAFGLFASVGIGFGIGWVISEAIGAATNRKRGPAVQGAAVYGAIVAYFARNIVLVEGLILRGDEFGYIAVAVAAIFGASRLKVW
jgi:hypothetical protein